MPTEVTCLLWMFLSIASHQNAPIPHLVTLQLPERLVHSLLCQREFLNLWLDTVHGAELEHLLVSESGCHEAVRDGVTLPEHRLAPRFCQVSMSEWTLL